MSNSKRGTGHSACGNQKKGQGYFSKGNGVVVKVANEESGKFIAYLYPFLLTPLHYLLLTFLSNSPKYNSFGSTSKRHHRFRTLTSFSPTLYTSILPNPHCFAGIDLRRWLIDFVIG